ncbi:MAG: transglycosylase SLT domain-containing protein [Bryobacterales bacterium]|nr:transglycosylase SLT domain-containing protein [Bryobacterales bacterium]
MTGTPTAFPNNPMWRLLTMVAILSVIASGQWIGADSASTEPLPSELLLAQNIRPEALQNRPMDARSEAFRRSAEHMRTGRQALESGRFLDARVEFDAAVEDLIGESSINFSTDTAARESLERLIQDIHRLESSRMDLADPSETPVYQQSPLDQIPELTFPIDPKLKATALEQILSRSGEFPLELNDTVLSYIRYFTSERGSRTFVAGYRRSGRYRDMILRILDEEGLPRELLHLAQAESGFLPRAVSWAAAGGLWQFIGSRGQEYGLLQTALTDDRFDPEKATRSAARHLHDLYRQFGDWNLAMAAYNCGPGCVERAIERTGYADFWELRRLNVIPKETTNYVPIVQALAIIALNPAAYGIELPEMDPPLRFDTHTLEAKTNLNLVADLLGITKAEIRDLNPAIKSDLAPAGYTLRVPKQSVPELLAGLNQVPSEKRVVWRAHRVSAGETLPAIAQQYRVTPSRIAEANELSAEGSLRNGAQSSAPVSPGDVLLIPATYSVPAAKASSRQKQVTRKKSARNRTTSKKRTSSTKPGTTASRAKSAKQAKATAKTPVRSTKRAASSRKATTSKSASTSRSAR